MFEDEPRGPLIRITDEEYAPTCHNTATGCDVVLGMSFCKYTGETALSPSDDNLGRLVCHGPRPRTEEEARIAELTGRPAAAGICDLEVVYTPVADLN
jgi:hypothetical protein